MSRGRRRLRRGVLAELVMVGVSTGKEKKLTTADTHERLQAGVPRAVHEVSGDDKIQFAMWKVAWE